MQPGPHIKAESKCHLCGGDIYYFHAYGHDGTCDRCWAKIKSMLEEIH